MPASNLDGGRFEVPEVLAQKMATWYRSLLAHVALAEQSVDKDARVQQLYSGRRRTVSGLLEERAKKLAEVEWEGMPRFEQRQVWRRVTMDCLKGCERALGIERSPEKPNRSRDEETGLAKEAAQGEARAERSRQVAEDGLTETRVAGGDNAKAWQDTRIGAQNLPRRPRSENRRLRIRRIERTLMDQIRRHDVAPTETTTGNTDGINAAPRDEARNGYHRRHRSGLRKRCLTPTVRRVEKIFMNPIRRLYLSPQTKTMQRRQRIAHGFWKERTLRRARRTAKESASQDVWDMMQQASESEALGQVVGVGVDVGVHPERQKVRDALSELEESDSLGEDRKGRKGSMKSRDRRRLVQDVREFMGNGGRAG
ncbi:hypothetical protein LTR85_001382 [Meristemomyces frigidus]|nr:hypothetical protein LTR85_001382 [Meristemomyces frigidus]